MSPQDMARLHGLAFAQGLPRPWSSSEFAALLDHPLVFALGESSGFLLGRVVAGEAELLTLAVDPLAWGQGIGGRLVQGFLDMARQRGGESAFLEVAANNERARDLYLRLGFSLRGSRKHYYHAANMLPQDALILVRAL